MAWGLSPPPPSSFQADLLRYAPPSGRFWSHFGLEFSLGNPSLLETRVRGVECRIRVVAAKRTNLSKKLRFEVFKRDGFRCQYCGAAAPDVLLVVDHVNPVAKGGKNNILNLITACEPCNA